MISTAIKYNSKLMTAALSPLCIYIQTNNPKYKPTKLQSTHTVYNSSNKDKSKMSHLPLIFEQRPVHQWGSSVHTHLVQYTPSLEVRH